MTQQELQGFSIKTVPFQCDRTFWLTQHYHVHNLIQIRLQIFALIAFNDLSSPLVQGGKDIQEQEEEAEEETEASGRAAGETDAGN